jgi:hypothetical protein
MGQHGDRGRAGQRTDVAVHEPIVGGASYGAFDAHQTMLFGPGQQGRRGRICLWMRYINGGDRCGGGDVGANTHARAAIGVAVGLDPDDVLASSVAPFGEDFATPLEALACAASDPHEDKGRICGEGGNWEFLELGPAERGRERRVEEDDVELERVEQREVLQR